MPNYLLSANPTAIRNEGGGTPGTYAGHDSCLWLWPCGAIRFKATTATIAAKLYRNGKKLTLYRKVSGVWQLVGRVTTANDATWADTTLFTGLDSVTEYEYLLVNGNNTTTTGFYFEYLTVATLNTADLPARRILASYGDSTVRGTAQFDGDTTFVSTGDDATYSDGMLIALAIDWSYSPRAYGGSTVKNKGGDPATSTASGEARTADIIATAADAVLGRYSLNDWGQVGGSETPSQLQTSFTNMGGLLVAGLPVARFLWQSILAVNPAGYPGSKSTWNAAIAASVTASGVHNAYLSIESIPTWDYTTDTIDGVHPNPTGYAKLAAFVVSTLADSQKLFTVNNWGDASPFAQLYTVNGIAVGVPITIGYTITNSNLAWAIPLTSGTAGAVGFYAASTSAAYELARVDYDLTSPTVTLSQDEIDSIAASVASQLPAPIEVTQSTIDVTES